ncbi:type IV secretion system DNA-binding domain-containing protein [Acidithiobacillus ferridurans]|uniref:type IV secretion system DNA-binding domain-containing protein n=1 Tax=Acidithiobacillus ferridurans TaxID=1232575 RepID=UPI001C07AF6C|nr:type IV secretion system DNA-binding domain-containing protein [Acidithiobacillus ferridurans]MBU2732612.1 type IV secretion system DNA-binding domain-containing protein [Acidithiobacillus ferridurans]
MTWGMPPELHYGIQQFPAMTALVAYLASWFGWHLMADNGMTWQALAAAYPAWTAHFSDHVLWSLAGGFMAGSVAAYGAGRPLPYERHIRGRQLVEQRQAHHKAAQSERSAVRRTGQGIRIHPAIRISMERETNHFAIVGSPGGGKTTVIMPMVVQAVDRGDKVILFDNKAYFTERLPQRFILIAPWDTRSVQWAVYKDCVSGADARELAARLILESHDPMWSNAARLVLTGLIVHLQQQGTPWGWRDLSVLLNLPIDGLQEIIETAYPEAWRSVEIASRTTQSILITLASYMAQIHDMARVWGNSEDGFSITEWLRDDYDGTRTIVMQGNQKFKEMQNSIVNGMLSMAGAHINSPAMNDSTERRIWLFLDEAPQLKKADWIPDIVAVGRSKGVRVVLGIQDIAQLREIYGRDQAESWTSMIGTYIFTKIGGNDTARWISETIGVREVERFERSTSTSSAFGGGNGNQQSTHSYRRAEDRVVKPDELTTLLGPTKKGVRGLLHLGDKYEYLLVWPYVHDKYPVGRKAWEPSAWVSQPPPKAEKPGVEVPTEFVDEGIAPTSAKPAKSAKPQASAEKPKKTSRKRVQEQGGEGGKAAPKFKSKRKAATQAEPEDMPPAPPVEAYADVVDNAPGTGPEA